MIIVKYLVVNHRGNVVIREREPSMKGNEIAVRVELNVPDELFERPILRANMKIPKEAVPKVNITAEVTDNIEKIIKQATGLEMAVTLVEHNETQTDEDTSV